MVVGFVKESGEKNPKAGLTALFLLNITHSMISGAKIFTCLTLHVGMWPGTSHP
jgi:hypothetical protein